MKTQQEFNRIAEVILFGDTDHAQALRQLYGKRGHRLYSIDKEKATIAFELANKKNEIKS